MKYESAVQEEKIITMSNFYSMKKCCKNVDQLKIRKIKNLKILISLKPNHECDFDPMKVDLSHDFGYIDDYFERA